MSAVAYFALGGLVVLIYVGLCVVLRRRGSRAVWYCVPLGAVAALSYAVNMWYAVGVSGGTLYNGFASDNTFQVAYVNNVLHGNYFGDFYDKVVPSHYPPLYFWMAGTIGRLFGADAIAVSIAAPFVVLAIAPGLAFGVGRYVAGERVGFYSAVAFLGLGNAMVSYVLDTPRSFPPVTWGIYKPYELLAGLVAVAWTVGSVRQLGRARLEVRRILILGVAGGGLFLLYYPWFLVAAATVVLFVVVERLFRDGMPPLHPARFGAIVAIAAAIGAPSWLPYAVVAFTQGADPNYAWEYTTLIYFDVSIVTIGLGYAGAIFFLGIYGLAATLRRDALRALALMLGILYVWYVSAFLTYPLTGTAFLSWKGRILIFVVLVFGAGLGLEAIRRRWQGARRILSSSSLICLAVLPLLPTILQWNPVTDEGLRAAQQPMPETVREIVGSLGGSQAELTVVASPEIGMYLPAVSQLRLYTSHTIHFSNPLARFAQRKAEIEALQTSPASAMPSAVSRLGIDALILDKLADGRLRLFLPDSARPTSVFDGDWPYRYIQVLFLPDQFTSSFDTVYENEDLLVLRVTEESDRAGTRAESNPADRPR